MKWKWVLLVPLIIALWFFFQAEDGIRDIGVTGVQTCALPILSLTEGALLAGLPKAPSAYTPRRSERRAAQRRAVVLGLMADAGYISRGLASRAEIGRASCRERV